MHTSCQNFPFEHKMAKGPVLRERGEGRKAHTSCHGAPSSSAMTCIASLLLKEGTLSHSFCSSFIAAGERMSGLIDSACPSCEHRHVPQFKTLACQSLVRRGPAYKFLGMP